MTPTTPPSETTATEMTTDRPTDESAALPDPSEEPRTDVPIAHDDAEEKRVPVSEAIRYRKRAQTAEQKLQSLETEYQTLQHRLEESQETITSLERRQKIDAMLAQSGAIDLEAARLLTEVAVAGMQSPDVTLAVRELRQHKPYLFRSHGYTRGSALSPQIDAEDGFGQAIDQAASTGDRRDLLHYLRLKRQA